MSSSRRNIRSFRLVKNDITHTIGAEFGSKIVHVNQKNIKLQIWDVSFVFETTKE